jgi:uncharacterized membrane protein
VGNEFSDRLISNFEFMLPRSQSLVVQFLTRLPMSATMMRMTMKHIAIIVLALSANMAIAQQSEESTLTVVVEDQAGAVIPGAHVTATAQATGTRIYALTDTNGQAIVHLEHGNYELKVQARGFEAWEDKVVELNAVMQRTVNLEFGHLVECGPCIDTMIPEIPLEHPGLTADLPPISIQNEFFPPLKLLRHRSHWF